ncbi:MAG TPA: protein translocase subunit SecF [Egibacteraceae bacterium]|mgnify:CR=1 FL=1
MTTPETSTPTAERGSTPGRLSRFFSGQSHIDFVGRSRLWAILTAIIMLLALIGIFGRGLNLGIDFTGGTSYVVTGATAEFTAEDLREAVAATGIEEVNAQVVSDDSGRGALVTTPALEIGGETDRAVVAALAEVTGASPDSIAASAVGPRWGQQISRQALRGLIVFIALVMVYISWRFEWRMAVAAILALFHDIVMTVGIYALVGFQVSPASVIAFLTILGYSLYDTIVVFDRVKEDTATLSSVSTRTYGEVANASLNHVLVRSLSTSLTSLLPVGSLLFIGANLLGADTLEDLALALFIGMAAGTYSSLVIATPVLVALKERQPRYRELKEKILARRGGAETPTTSSPPQRRRRKR